MLPTATQINEKATEIFHAREGAIREEKVTNPSLGELKENGDYKAAQLELMTNEETKAKEEMRKYLGEMAKDLGLVMMSEKDARELRKTVFIPQLTPKPDTLKKEPEKPKLQEPQQEKKTKSESWLRQLIQARIDVYLAKKRYQKAIWENLAEKARKGEKA